jgi:hypothetical protein
VAYFELTPAYGKDYKTAMAVTEAWNDYLDFLGDWQMGFQVCNKQDFKPGDTVNLRYRGNTRVAVVKVQGAAKAAAEIRPVKGGFMISRKPCAVCGEPAFGGEYCCGHDQEAK